MGLVGMQFFVARVATTPAWVWGVATRNRRGLRALLSLALLATMVTLLTGALRDLDAAAVRSAMAQTAPGALIFAAVFTGLSFLPIAAYDVLAHRVLARPVPPTQALQSGFVATAIGQCTGFGMVVGSFLRWRMTRAFNQRPLDAVATTALVTVGFTLGALAVLSASMLLAPNALTPIVGLPVGLIQSIGALGVLGTVVALALCWWQPAGLRWSPPPFRAALRFIGLTLADVLPAAAALWVLLPQGAGIGFAELFPLFLAALMLGLATGVPGGVGVLEGACLVAFAAVPQTELVAALILYRAIYYGLPMILAAGVWATEEARRVRPATERRNLPRQSDLFTPGRTDLPPAVINALGASPSAESALALLGDKSFLFTPDRGAMWMAARGANALVGLSDPLGPMTHWPQAIDVLTSHARAQLVTPVIYRTGPACAALLRAQGWTVARQGAEALVDLEDFTLNTPARAGLRRKLRRAATKGVAVTRHAPGTAPWAQMAAISDLWLQHKHRTERGFSLGRFDQQYLEHFHILTAQQDGAITGFLSLWCAGDGGEWSLDLMRLGLDAADGTMQTLITDAIIWAKAEGALQFSLCSVPLAGLDAPDPGLERVAAAIWQRQGAKLGLHGMHQFKSQFAPNWEPRYFAVPSVLDTPTALRGLNRLIG